MHKLICVILIMSLELWGQPSRPRPTFNEFSVKDVYQGAPAAPKLNGDQRVFRTMIRRGAKVRVQFAAHYTVPRWGCGTDCNAFAIVDSVNGRVYDGFGVAELPLAWLEKQSGDAPERMEFHPDSRLMKINGCPNEANCGFYDYVMVDGEGLKLVRKELLPKNVQY